MEGIEIGMMIITLGISILALYNSNLVARQQLAIEQSQEDERQKELQTATLVATIQRESQGICNLTIVNEGEAIALDVDVLLDGKNWMQHETVIQAAALPNSIEANSSVTRKLVVHTGLESPLITIEMRWLDGTGTKSRTQELSLI